MRRAEFKRGDLLDRAFAIGIILKGLDGILEVVGGVLLLLISPTTIDSLTRAIFQHELSQDPVALDCKQKVRLITLRRSM